MKIDPNNVEALVTLGETRNSQGRAAEGVALIQKAIRRSHRRGQKPEEAWYKRAVKLSFDAKLPTTPALAVNGLRHIRAQELARCDPHLSDQHRAGRCDSHRYDEACAGCWSAPGRE
jgi:hypothetical protein